MFTHPHLTQMLVADHRRELLQAAHQHRLCKPAHPTVSTDAFWIASLRRALLF